MKSPRQQHYIPRFYLSGFVDPSIFARDRKEVIWVYERGKDVRRSSPEKEARQRDSYTFEQSGFRNVEIEERFGKLEAAVAPIISNLATSPRHVTESEKQILALFLGTMPIRTPAGRCFSVSRTMPFITERLTQADADP